MSPRDRLNRMDNLRQKTKGAAASPVSALLEPPLASAMPSKHDKSYRVLVVDDHPVVRRGVRAILETQPGIEVCCEASNGLEAMEQVKKAKPDLVVLDLTMPEMNGLEVTTAVREQSPETEVLVLSMHFSDELGARGAALRSARLRVEIRPGHRAARGRGPRAPAQAVFHLETGRDDGAKFRGRPAAKAIRRDRPIHPLTEREIQVVQLLAEGKSNKEVAATLGVSTRTIESHRNHIMRKMNFTSFSDMIRFAVRSNLVDAVGAIARTAPCAGRAGAADSIGYDP